MIYIFSLQRSVFKKMSSSGFFLSYKVWKKLLFEQSICSNIFLPNCLTYVYFIGSKNLLPDISENMIYDKYLQGKTLGTYD